MSGLRVHRPQQHSKSQQGRSLWLLKEQLKETHDSLQKERANILEQHRLFSGLAEVLGHYRASLQEEEDTLCFDVEQMLLQQLQLLHTPACSQVTRSSAASNGSISLHGSPAAGPQELRSTCSSKGNSISHAAHTLHAHWPASCPALPAHCRQDTVSTAPCSLQQQHNQPYAPDEDPFLLVRMMLDMPLDPRATDTTLSDLRARWAADVQQLQLYLHQLQASAGLTGPSTAAQRPAVAPAESCSHPATVAADAGDPVGAASSYSFGSSAQEMQWSGQQQQQQQQQQQEETDPLQGILDLQLRMIGLLWSLSTVDKAPLFFELQLTNWHTGERITEPCRERHRAALKELQLTPAQQQRMAAGWKFFQQLLGPVVAERKQLHAQGLQVEGFGVAAPSASAGGANGTTCAGSHAAANGCSSVPGVAGSAKGAAVTPGSAAACAPGMLAGQHPVYVAHSGHGARLQAQREQLSRLPLLARKDTLLRGTMAVYMQGCLSLVQQAKLRVAMSPYQANIGILCVALMEQMQQQKQ